METKRAASVGFFSYEGGFVSTPILRTAALAIVALFLVLGWAHFSPSRSTYVAASVLPATGTTETIEAASPQATSTDEISQIGASVLTALEEEYVAMKNSGTYSTSSATQAASSLAQYMQAPVSYIVFSPSNIKSATDTSYDAMMRYRSALQGTLKGLTTIQEPEYQTFGDYVMTKDPQYLAQLRAVAAIYFAAASSSAALVVPADAVPVQVGILDAMEEFGSTLDALADHADDPFASAALLESYNQAESDMVTSFQALATYEKSKLP